MAGELDVCVVIPTYRRPELLRQALDAVFAQTRRPRQIVVVNDGADEATAEALLPYSDRVTVIAQARGGVQSARNTGARAATTTWIAMLDDDDRYQPDFLESSQEAMNDGRVDLIFTDHRKFRGDRPFGRTNFQMAPKDFWPGISGHDEGRDWSFIGRFPLEKLLKFIPFYPSTMLIRRSLFESLGGYDARVAKIATEDVEFLVRALSSGRLAIVWRALLDYRVHPGNVSGGSRRQSVGRWRIFEFIERFSDGVDPAFKARLKTNDLPARRRAIFDLAFQAADFELLNEVEPLVADADWSTGRSMKRSISRMPQPLARRLARLVSAPRSSAQALRRWSHVVRGIKA